MKKLLLVYAVLIICAGSFGCSWFMLKNSKSAVITGRTMDFETPASVMATEMVAVPAGTMQVVPGKEKEPKEKPTKYNYIGLNVFKSDALCDGLNQTGLGISALWLEGSKFKDPRRGDTTISLKNLVGWILGNFEKVEEVKEAIKKVVVTKFSLPPYIQEDIPIQITATDSDGHSITIEFLDGKTNIYDNDRMRVLTNTKQKELELLALSLDKYSNIDGKAETLQGSSSSLGRFARLYFANKFMFESRTAAKGIENAIMLLSHTVTSNGENIEKEGAAPTRTIWSVIKDHTNLRIYFNTEEDNDYRYVSLNDAMLFSGKIRNFSIVFEAPEHKCENKRFFMK